MHTCAGSGALDLAVEHVLDGHVADADAALPERVRDTLVRQAGRSAWVAVLTRVYA